MECPIVSGMAEFPCGSGKYYPFYPIQTMCEQANFCIVDGNIPRLRELHQSAEYHKDRYKGHEYNFIIEHLNAVLKEIKDEEKKAKVRQQLKDY